jgi:cellobiose epimerase
MTSPASVQSDSTGIRCLSAELRSALDREFRCWYPAAIDSTCGGFYSDLNSRWEVEGVQNKMIVTQARHVWAASNATLFYGINSALRDVARHGLRYLQEVMWDPEFGGFYWLVDRGGRPIHEDGRIVKRAYGNAFAIYGLAAYYHAFGDPASLDLAKKTFSWLESHSYDPDHGGYFQFLTREGEPLREGFDEPPKDQNSTIHLLEAFAELYRVWPHPLVRQRLHELLLLVRDRITSPDGSMRLFFAADWTPVSYRDALQDVREKNYGIDHISFCHDIEVAYLLLDAAEALGMPLDPTTLRVAKRMTDHTLSFGWDAAHGGIFDRGYLFAGEERPRIIQKTKEWWGQIEGLNTLQLMAALFPDDPLAYGRKFLVQWEYCKHYVIDSANGGWYWGGTDGDQAVIQQPKASIWKCDYHTSRGLINCIRRLEETVACPARE